MRVTWYGTLTFGLVSVPVGLHTARETQGTSFRMIHKGCGERIKQVTTCPTHGPLDASEVGKGYEYAKGEVIEVNPEELKDLGLDNGRSIEIDRFVLEGDVDPLLYDKAYHLVPADETAQRGGYVMLASAMKNTKSAAIARFVQNGRDHVCIVRVKEGVLMLHTLFFAEDIRHPAEIEDRLQGIKASKAEIDLAESLVNNLRGDFDHDTYVPEHRERIRAFVAATMAGKKPKAAPKPKAKPVGNLEAALKASIAAVQAEKVTTAPKPRRAAKAKA